VSEGTWVLPVELGGRPLVIDPATLLEILPLFRPSRSCVGCDHAPRVEDKPVLAVPGRDSEAMRLARLWLKLARGLTGSSIFPSPSSEAISVIRDETRLGGRGGNNVFGTSAFSDDSAGVLEAMMTASSARRRCADYDGHWSETILSKSIVDAVRSSRTCCTSNRTGLRWVARREISSRLQRK
jgi:hypothetical protein